MVRALSLFSFSFFFFFPFFLFFLFFVGWHRWVNGEMWRVVKESPSGVI